MCRRERGCEQTKQREPALWLERRLVLPPPPPQSPEMWRQGGTQKEEVGRRSPDPAKLHSAVNKDWCQWSYKMVLGWSHTGPSHLPAPGRELLTASVKPKPRKQLGIWGKLLSTSLISLLCRQKEMPLRGKL